MFHFFLKLFKAFKNSWHGLKNAWNSQWAFRVEVVFLLPAIPCVFYLGHNAAERVLLFGSVFLVLIIELINSAIETTVDRISLERHELSGLAKDLASAAVLLAIVNMIITWSLILFFQIL